MTDKPPSERRLIAQRIAAFIIENHLANPFGGEVDQSDTKGRPYSVLLSIPRLLDGQVRVYGQKFILINFVGPLAKHGSEFVYTSEQDAIKFLRLMLVDHQIDDALAIPTKPPRSAT